MDLYNFYGKLMIALLAFTSYSSEIIQLRELNDILSFSLTTQTILNQSQSYFIAQILDGNHQAVFKYTHLVAEDVRLQIEIGKDKKAFYSVISNEDYLNKTLQLTFIYNVETLKLNIEIIQVQNNKKIILLNSLEILQLNILCIGGYDGQFQKYSGMIELNRLSSLRDELMLYINNRLIEQQNELQYIILNQSQNDFIIVESNHTIKNKMVFYGNSYEQEMELNIIIDNYQHIIITDLHLLNDKSKAMIDSQSVEEVKLLIQNSTICGQFQALINNFGYLEINNVNFTNITIIQFQFQDQTTNIMIKFVKVQFYNCSFDKSQLFPPLQSGDVIFINVKVYFNYNSKFIKCSFAYNSFILQPFPGFLQVHMISILIKSSRFDTHIMFQNVGDLKVENFTIIKCNFNSAMIFSGNSQTSLNYINVFNSNFDKSYLIMMFVSKEDKVQYSFRVNGLVIKNNTIPSNYPHFIAVTGYYTCSIINLIYKSNKLQHKFFVFFISSIVVNIIYAQIEKISLQTEFYIVTGNKLVVQHVKVYGINKHHNSFMVIKNSYQVDLYNISIHNLELEETQLFLFTTDTIKRFILNDIFIHDVQFAFSDVSSNNIEMFKLLNCYEITIQNLHIYNLTYFIDINELKQKYLIFYFSNSNSNIKMKNISIENVKSYFQEQYSGIKFIYSPIMYIFGSSLQIDKSRFLNLDNNSTIENQIGQIIVNQIYITQTNFSNITATSILQITLTGDGTVYFYDCKFYNLTISSDDLILFEQQESSLACQINEITIEQIQCTQECIFLKFHDFQIQNSVALSNIQINDIALIQFRSNNYSQVAIFNVTARNNIYLYQNIIDLQCSKIVISNIVFEGYSYGNLMNLVSHQLINLELIYVINSIFYESSIFQIKLEGQHSKIIIRQLVMANNKVVYLDFDSQRRALQQNNYNLISIIDDYQNVIFMDKSNIMNNFCSICFKGLIQAFSRNSTSLFAIQSTVFQNNLGSNMFQVENFLIFYLRQVVFFDNTMDQYLISLTNTHLSLFQSQIFNDKILENISQRTDYIIIDSQFFGHFYEQNGIKQNNSQYVIQQSGVPLYLRLFYKDAQFKIESHKNQQFVEELIVVNKFQIFGDQQYQNMILLPSNNIYPYSYYDPHQQIDIFYDLNYTIRIIDKQGDILQDQQVHELSIQQYLYNLTSSSQIVLLDEQVLTYDGLRQGFLLEKVKIKFNPYSDDSLCVQLKINYQTMENYSLLVNVRTFKCQIGEYFQNDICHQCNENNYQYSLLPNQLICKQVDFEMIEEFKYNQVKLRKGFWRRDILSEKFIFCENNPQACLGGWKAGNDECSTSFIGPMCEECDQHNVMGNGYYLKNYDNQCYQCNYSKSVIILFVSILFIIILTLAVIKNIQSQNNLFHQYFLQYKQFEIMYKLNQNQYNTLIKQIINILYLFMIFKLINGWQIVSYIDHFYYFTSNPLSFNQLNFYCLFQLYDPRYSLIIYVITPCFIIVLCWICVCLTKKQITFSQTSIYSSIIFVLCYLQPNIIRELSQFISYRQILDKIYVKGSLQYLFDSIYHQRWIKIFIAPQTVYYSFTLPLLALYFLFKIRNDLIQKRNRFKYMFLFNDYNSKYYFWEVYRILNRELIIFLIIFYDTLVWKLQITFFILCAYCFLLNKFKPFNSVQCNKFEEKQYLNLLVNNILQMMILSLSIQDSLRQIIITLTQLSSYFLLITFAYQIKFISQRYIKSILKNLIIKGPFISNYIQNFIQKKELKQRKINIYWNLFKTHSRTIGRQASYSSLPSLDAHDKTTTNSETQQMRQTQD